MFKKAEKKNLKLRMALCGPAGAGKTYSALAVASAIGGKIAVVDTEHGSASKYADIFTFDVVEPSIFDPRDLIEIIRYAEKSGYAHIIIDSLSHYWSGKGGELDMVDNAAARSKSANTFTAWKTVTPVHNDLIDTIISCKINVFATMRSKTDYVIETNASGKQVPRKIGLAPIMRDGIEYEFDLCGDLDQDNNFVITKSRCSELSGRSISRPGKQIAEALVKWLASGVTREEAKTERAPLPVEKPQENQQSLASRCVGDAKPEPEFVPGAVEFERVEIASADRPIHEPNNMPAAQVANEIKQVRTLAQKYGCKSQQDFADLMLTITGKELSTASQLTDNTERANVISWLNMAMSEQNEAAQHG